MIHSNQLLELNFKLKNANMHGGESDFVHPEREYIVALSNKDGDVHITHSQFGSSGKAGEPGPSFESFEEFKKWHLEQPAFNKSQ
ncbi:hypothetical protein [Fulvivirga sp.]|uniref:hypothetical protein n=1 Tax=Fulvivirga sp. TaxID=1931237 RepID=UPI0032EB3B79